VPVRTATADDLDDVLALLAARDHAVLGEVEVRRRYVEHQLAQAKDSVVARHDRSLAGYGSLDAEQNIALAAVDAAAADDVLGEIETRARGRGFGHVTCVAVPEDRLLRELLERSGYERERDIVRMWRSLDGDLPSPSWPDGVEVRSYDDRDGERVHALLDAAYAGWDPDNVELGHEDWLAFMTDHEDFDPSLWFLGERNGELVGCTLLWRASGGDGWVKDIVVAEDERGKGLGRALLEHAFRAYRGRGAARVGLKVDTSNPTSAVRLYERTGFVVDRTYRIWSKPL
jgi:mycothiol synthase